MNNILIVDDDPHIRELIGFALEKAHYTVALAKDGKQALTYFTESPCDLIVLDINMAEMDGLECCREIRKTSEVPILFLSSRDEEIDRILGLEIGGDDYVTKPFSPRELVARIKVILKRSATQHTNSPLGKTHEQNTFTHGLLRLNKEQYAVEWDRKQLSLTAIEFAMLLQMIKQPRHVFSRDMIMAGSYADNIHVSDRTIDSHIRHIRQKFTVVGCPGIIETQHGVGYRLGSCE